jgi:uridine phosphorylase
VRRAVRVGTCTVLRAELAPGALVTVTEAHAWSGPGGGDGEAVAPDAELAASLRERLGEAARPGSTASLDVLHAGGDPAPVAEGDVADMQTAALFGAARRLGIAAAAVLIVSADAAGEPLGDAELEAAAKVAGRAAAAIL